MEQKRQHEENNQQMADMSQQILKMEGMIGMLVNSKSTRKSKPAAFVAPSPSPTTSAPAAPPAALPAVAPPTITINFHGSDGPGGSVATPTIPSITASVTETLSGSVPLITTATSSGSTGSAAPAPLALAPLAVLGLVPPVAALAYTGPWSARREELQCMYGEDAFNKHKPWVWKVGELLPSYQYQPMSTIMDVWTEWTAGLGGHIPVRELTEKWGNHWRHNNAALKMEGGHRKKIIELIAELSQKSRWSVQLALHFLEEKYHLRYRAHKFCEYLTESGGVGRLEVLKAAMKYP
ncbi:hypothetical protein SCP_0406610 [Sparassis crispa]|uniref:Transcription activator GCR1-like domain-containing protein n=1 Tax=Sparassis crispa TaxID=139825 RepID=A0A401GJD1_9APHY|nr:hypothetical protein SCP_0406610 [Sparassis crispa]GBE82277.1 hypothetical protein SCP_0406610 [Sparassis crispa]